MQTRDSIAAAEDSRAAVDSSVPEAPVACALDGCYGDGMVFQRRCPVVLRGRAPAGSRIKVRFGAVEAGADTGVDGVWCVTLPPFDAGGPYTVHVEGETGECLLRDIWVGEVWLCAGQSNIIWPVGYLKERDKETQLENLREKQCRLMLMPERSFAEADDPLPSLSWQWSSEEDLLGLPALPGALGPMLEEHLGCKVGLMVSALGGSRISSWIPRSAYAGEPSLADYLRDYPPDPRGYEKRIAAWKAEREAFDAQNGARGARGEPVVPFTKYLFWGPRGTRSLAYPGGAFDAMIRPLAHLHVAGILWYQGESDAEYPERYACRLRLLMREWRGLWAREAGLSRLPFAIVQLPQYSGDSASANWPHIREAQMRAAEDSPETAVVPTLDLGDVDDIHPSDKLAFARRIIPFMASFSKGEPPPTAPVLASFSVESAPSSDAKTLVRVRLSQPVRKPGGDVVGFEIIDTNGDTLPLGARFLDSETLALELPIAAHAFRGLRYAWKAAPDPLLLGGGGLPVLPFRSDAAPPPYRAETLY